MDLERALLEGDLTRLTQDVDDAEQLVKEIEDSTEHLAIHLSGLRELNIECGILAVKMLRLRRDLKVFVERWKEHKPANARPKSRKRTPEVKQKRR